MLQTTLIVPGLDDSEPGHWQSWLEKQLPDARRVRLYQAVTLGAKRFEVGQDGGLAKGLPRHPELDDDVVVYAGTTIPGRITIGKAAPMTELHKRFGAVVRRSSWCATLRTGRRGRGGECPPGGSRIVFKVNND